MLRYGIAEWYGFDFMQLSSEQIHQFAEASITKKQVMHCPFRKDRCNKKGGICSMRLYDNDNNIVKAANEDVVTMCPERFLQDDIVFKWVAETILHTQDIELIKELPFLISPNNGRAVGKIDMVIVDLNKKPLSWCALEMQAVYFSGDSMDREFKALIKWNNEGIPFPIGNRHPDFRSSGPKRLMPQLQIKVPTISRWGKKTVVVLDTSFFNNLGSMNEIQHLSNCDIVWCILDYKQNSKKDRYILTPKHIQLTTLDRAVEGLTSGVPTSLESFEEDLCKRIRQRQH